MIRALGLVAVIVMVALTVAGVAGSAAGSAAVVRVPAVGYRLHATLAPVGSATGSGRFDALLVRSGPGATRSSAPLPSNAILPAGCRQTKPLMGIACRIGGGSLPPFTVPATGVHWLLVWRIALTGVTGPASANIHLGAQGAASPIMTTLCSSCQAVARGHLSVAADQSRMLLNGDGYVDVQAASGQLSGHIVTINHVYFMAPARTGH
jgi:hypothetical protein